MHFVNILSVKITYLLGNYQCIEFSYDRITSPNINSSSTSRLHDISKQCPSKHTIKNYILATQTFNIFAVKSGCTAMTSK